ncbi:hypothetical protein [Polyangium sp. 6x1]|uniref:hypothetical protein n=1 Tax=Polyangium sp. 6x1 TaxID=3042689 RepID=UPI002482E2ED|nr:hypothetical protein [Polyangium sp. 6x1]MDI1449670.1 hypothetical protein [Polyangium sp. 6x1]
MRAHLSAFLLVVTIASPAKGESPPGITPDVLSRAARESAFAAHVAKGDHERAEGRFYDAAAAYADALAIRHDPVVSGRLGVLMVHERPSEAAELLLDAIKHANTSPTERRAFSDAYEAVRAKGCWVDVILSHAGARFTIDGKPRNELGFSAFSLFVLAGEHEVRASLDGYADAVRTFRAVPKEDVRIELILKLRAPAGIEPGSRVPKLDERPLSLAMNELRLASTEPTFTKQEDPFAYEDPPSTQPAATQKPTRGSLGAGPVVVFGVASWMPAVGVVAGGSFRPNEFVSLGLEGRAAWLTTGVGGEPISAMTAGGIASVCGHYRWAFGCAIGHVGVIRVEPSSDGFKSEVATFVKPGIGGRVGARFVLARNFAVHGGVDLLGLSSGVRIGVGQRVLAETPPIMIGASILGSWEF